VVGFPTMLVSDFGFHGGLSQQIWRDVGDEARSELVFTDNKYFVKSNT
jgi:hypothetical protein